MVAAARCRWADRRGVLPREPVPLHLQHPHRPDEARCHGSRWLFARQRRARATDLLQAPSVRVPGRSLPGPTTFGRRRRGRSGVPRGPPRPALLHDRGIPVVLRPPPWRRAAMSKGRQPSRPFEPHVCICRVGDRQALARSAVHLRGVRPLGVCCQGGFGRCDGVGSRVPQGVRGGQQQALTAQLVGVGTCSGSEERNRLVVDGEPCGA